MTASLGLQQNGQQQQSSSSQPQPIQQQLPHHHHPSSHQHQHQQQQSGVSPEAQLIRSKPPVNGQSSSRPVPVPISSAADLRRPSSGSVISSSDVDGSGLSSSAHQPHLLCTYPTPTCPLPLVPSPLPLPLSCGVSMPALEYLEKVPRFSAFLTVCGPTLRLPPSSISYPQLPKTGKNPPCSLLVISQASPQQTCGRTESAFTCQLSSLGDETHDTQTPLISHVRA